MSIFQTLTIFLISSLIQQPWFLVSFGRYAGLPFLLLYYLLSGYQAEVRPYPVGRAKYPLLRIDHSLQSNFQNARVFEHS